MSEHETELEPGEPLAPGEEEAEEEAERERELAEPDETADIAEHEAAAERELKAAHATYLRAVHDHFGPEAKVYPCPTCATNGYVVADLHADAEVERCEGCGGLGITVTGSLVEGNETRPCPRCHAAGFVAIPGAVPAPEPLPVVSVPPPLPPEAFPPVSVPPPELTPVS